MGGTNLVHKRLGGTVAGTAVGIGYSDYFLTLYELVPGFGRILEKKKHAPGKNLRPLCVCWLLERS